MKIELPNYSGQPTAIVLGGTNPHIELIHQLKSRGYYVILVDYLNHPPAKDHADLHVQESTMDPQKVLEVAEAVNASLVISACVDQANITACYVAEKMGLTKPYSYEVAQNITNKGHMKAMMQQYGVPTTKHVYLEAGSEIGNIDLRFPMMVKPADSCAASGVKRANNSDELERFWNEACNVSRTGRTIIEEVAQGAEVSAYCFIENHEAHIIMISERLSVIEGERQVLKCYATLTPPRITETATAKIKDAANAIARAYGLNNTPLHVQAMCNGDEINIIEFAPRVGGGISYETIRDNTGFDIISATIDSYLEHPITPVYHPVNTFFSVNNIYGIPGTFDRLEGAEELIEEGVIRSIHYHRTSGTVIDDSRASSSRIAAFVAQGNTPQEMEEKIAYAMNHINAYDPDGNSVMRKDLYFKG